MNSYFLNLTNEKITYVKIVLSALLYSFAFLFIDYLWWSIFISLFLIYDVAVKNSLNFRHGFLWAFIAFGISLSGIFFSLYKMADYSAYYIPLIALVSLIYISLYGGLWFFSSQFLLKNIISFSKFSSQTIIFIKSVTWSFTSVIFFEILYRGLLWPFGVIEGLIVIHPLLPLTKFPQLLSFLPILGISINTFLLFFFLCFLALPEINYRFKFFLIFTVYILLGLKTYSLKKFEKPSWLNEIIYVPQSFYHEKNFNQSIKDAANKIQNIVKENSNVKLILFPESSLYLCHVNKWKEQISNLSTHNIPNNVSILIGGLRSDNQKIYNTVYHIKDGKIQDWYDKKHAMVLTERLPKWADTQKLRKLYYTIRPIINIGENKRPIFKITDNLSVIPFICSEIFFTNNQDFYYSKKYPITSFCNDNWIFVPYLEKLMRLVNKFRAIEWSRDILYISYSHGLLYTPHGQEIKIKKA